MTSIYLPAALMMLVAGVVSSLIFVASKLAGPKNMTKEKAIPYESGSATAGAQHIRLSVKFYLTAILFVVFDIEAVFLYPWAMQFRSLGWFGLWEMLVFLLILGIALIYAWRKGALEWER